MTPRESTRPAPARAPAWTPAWMLAWVLALALALALIALANPLDAAAAAAAAGRAPAAASPAPAPAPPPAVSSFRLASPAPDSLLSVAFAVERPVEVVVEAVGLRPRLAEDYAVDAWLLDAGTRRPVWRLAGKERQTTAESRLLCRAEDRLTLAPGVYVLRLAAASRWRTEAPFQSWGDALNDIADMISREDPQKNRQEYYGRCFAAVTQAGGAPALRPAVDPGPAGALLRLGPAGDDEDLVQPFRVARETTVRLRAIGESMRDTLRIIDTAWIERAADGSVVWQAEGKTGRHAGGARKNRQWDAQVRLPAGDYLARFATDHSHAWGAWNMVPPFDPDGYGLAILPGPGASYQPGDLRPLDESEARRGSSLLAELLRVRDGQKRRQEFTLARAARVRIEAMGEGTGDPLADGGSILDLGTGRQVWEMKYGQTEPAGGARKNRRCAAEIDLPAGRYVARYEADGSHAFGDWNAAPPDEPLRWGMTVRLVR